MEVIMASHAGATTEEFQGIVKEWLAAAKRPQVQQTFYRYGLPTDAGTACLSWKQGLQDLHRFRWRS